jgi:acyl-coenzyme A thioesterase PaaI-like protein
MSDDTLPRQVLPLDRTFDGTIGTEVLELGDDVVRGRFPVVDAVRQPYGIVHGGRDRRADRVARLDGDRSRRDG